MVIRSLTSAARFRPLVFVVEPILTERLIYAEVLTYNLRPAPVVECYATLAEAHTGLERTPPLMVVTAWHFRESSAADLLAAMRERPDPSAVPVIVLVNPDEPPQIAAAERAGAVAVLAKPVRPARLLEVCQSAITAQIARFPQLPPSRAGAREAS